MIFSSNKWIPVKFRKDKQEIYESRRNVNMFDGMNSMASAKSVWECIMNPITEDHIF